MRNDLEVHRLQILDPATGTGTFLLEMIELIQSGFSRQAGKWRGYVKLNDRAARAQQAATPPLMIKSQPSRKPGQRTTPLDRPTHQDAAEDHESAVCKILKRMPFEGLAHGVAHYLGDSFE